MKRSVLGALGIVAVLATAAGCVDRSAVQRTGAVKVWTVPFDAKFETSSDFYDRFDYGYSGQESWNFPGGIKVFHGDHDMNCGGPDTGRDVVLSGTGPTAKWSQLFWHCAPGGDPAKGHVMTGVDSLGYNIAWFSPRPFFANVTKVCWDINETELSHRKWTQVLFVGQADATRYPTGTGTVTGGVATLARGTGGFDLGYTSPDFRDNGGPSAGVLPQGGTLAGVKIEQNAPSWFQDQDTFTTRFQGPGNILNGITDKAARFQQCLENQPGNVVRLTQATPSGTRTFDMQGQIPRAPVRVVFQDDNYNGPKDEAYDPNVLTWHWDNIHIEAGAAIEMPAPPSPSPGRAVTAAASPPPGEAALPPSVRSPEGAAGDAGGGAPLFNIVGVLLIVTGLVGAFLLGRRSSRRAVS